MIKDNKKLAIACFSMVLLMVGLTFYPLLLTDRVAFAQTGLLLPALYLIEFCFILPIYLLYFRKVDSMGTGFLNLRQFMAFLFLVLFAQYAGAYILDIRKTETWITEQESIKGGIFWMNTLLLIFLVPIYEEIVFRGCLFSAFLQCFRGDIYSSSLMTSILFAVLHTQYTDIRTLIILVIVSLILIGARIVSRGLMMPMLLHMAMNGTVMGLSYYFA